RPCSPWSTGRAPRTSRAPSTRTRRCRRRCGKPRSASPSAASTSDAAGGITPPAAPRSLLRLFLLCVWLRRRSGGCCRRRLVLHDLEQLAIELERGAGLDLRGRAAVAVRHVGGADELRLAAGLHLGDALGPTLDHLVQREGRRLPALDRAVEDRAVDELAGVVHLHLVGGLRLLSGA